MNLVQVVLANCNTNDTVILIGSNGYPIDSNILNQIGIYNGGGMSIGTVNCLRAHIYLVPECGFQDSSHHIVTLSGHTFCGDLVSATDTSEAVFAWNDSSHCTDCFTIQKIASAATVNVGYTVTTPYTFVVIMGHSKR
nr:hypothetical protein [Bacteroidota bacterium]